jgi:hypothetical protein
MNLYLDIDGTLITKQGGIEANHLYEFLLFATENHDCYWLTSHCKGDASTALEHLKGKVSEESFELLKKVKPTTFELWKTEGIDFGKDFLWFDDYAFDGEREELKRNNSTHKLVEINLRENPDQLLDMIQSMKDRPLI